VGQSSNFNNRLDNALFESKEELESYQIKDEFERDERSLRKNIGDGHLDEVALINSKYEKLCFKNDKLDHFLNSLDLEFAEQKENLSFKKRKIYALREELKNKSSEYHVKLREQDKEKKLTHNLKKLIENNEDKIRSLNLNLNSLENEIHSLAHDNDRMKLHLEQKISKSHKIREEITAKDLKLINLRKQESLLKREVRNFPELEVVASKIKNSNFQEIEAKEKRIQELAGKKLIWSKKLNTINAKSAELKKILFNLNVKIKDHLNMLDNIKKRGKFLTKENFDLKCEINERGLLLSKLTANKQYIHDKMAKLISENKKNHQHNDSLKNQLNNLLEQAHKTQKKGMELKQENIELHENINLQLKKIKMTSDEFNKIKNETETKEKLFNEQKKRHDNLNREIKNKQADFSQAMVKKEKLNNDFGHMAVKIQRKQKKVAALNRELESLNQEHASLNQLLEKQNSLGKFL